MDRIWDHKVKWKKSDTQAEISHGFFYMIINIINNKIKDTYQGIQRQIFLKLEGDGEVEGIGRKERIQGRKEKLKFHIKDINKMYRQACTNKKSTKKNTLQESSRHFINYISSRCKNIFWISTQSMQIQILINFWYT